MRYVKQTIPLFLLAVFALANLAQAEVRGAASKIMGSYDQFDRSSNLRAAPVFSTHRGDGAERTDVIAAFCDLEICK